jgi:trehalose-6-phosphatase
MNPLKWQDILTTVATAVFTVLVLSGRIPQELADLAEVTIMQLIGVIGNVITFIISLRNNQETNKVKAEKDAIFEELQHFRQAPAGTKPRI